MNNGGIKCPQCGLVNWETEQACNRCGASLQGQNYQPPPQSYQWQSEPPQSYQPQDYQEQNFQPAPPVQTVAGESPMSLPQFGYANFAGAPSTQTPVLDPERGGKVWRWYVAYCVLMALVYLAFAAVGGFLLFYQFAFMREAELTQIRMQGGVMLAMGALFLSVFAAAPFLPKKPWNWIVGMILICLGLTSCCFMPISIPLLIQWLKPEVKAFFGRPT